MLSGERCDQAADHDGAEQCGAERGPELLGGVLQASRLASVRVADRRLDDVPELGDDQPHADPEHAHRREEGAVVEVRLDDGEQHQGRGQRDQKAHANDGARSKAGSKRRAGECGNEEARGGGQHSHPGLERVEPLHDLQVQRNGEEDAHQDQVLDQQHREAGAKPRDLEQAEVDQRVSSLLLAAAFPGAERGQYEAAGGDHEGGEGEAERLDGRVERLQPAPVACLQNADHDQRKTRGP